MRADRIGSALLRRGAKREPVLVFMRRSGAMIAAFFGVWKANCFYVPVDAEMGENRIRSILERVKPRFAVMDDSAEPMLSVFAVCSGIAGCAGSSPEAAEYNQ